MKNYVKDSITVHEFLQCSGIHIENLICPHCQQLHEDINYWAIKPHQMHYCLHCHELFEGKLKGVSMPVLTDDFDFDDAYIELVSHAANIAIESSLSIERRSIQLSDQIKEIMRLRDKYFKFNRYYLNKLSN